MLPSGAAMVGFPGADHPLASGGYSPLLAAVMLAGFGSAGTAFGTMVTASHGVADGTRALPACFGQKVSGISGAAS